MGRGDLRRLVLEPGKEGAIKGLGVGERRQIHTFERSAYLKVVTLESKGDKSRCRSRMLKPWIWSDKCRETAPEKGL